MKSVIKIVKLNWSRRSFEEDGWDSTTFNIYADKKMVITDKYTQSGLRKRECILTDAEYGMIYKILLEMGDVLLSCSGLDGIGWKMYINGKRCFCGYVFSDEPEYDVVEILDWYCNNLA